MKKNKKAKKYLRKKIMNNAEWKKEIWGKMRDGIQKMYKFNLSLEEALKTNIVAESPFWGPNSVAFIKSVKRGNINTTLNFLEDSRRLIFEYDHVSLK